MYVQTALDLTSLDDIKEEIEKQEEVFIENKLVRNTDEANFLLELKEAFKDCKSFSFSIAFINFSGLQLILDELKSANDRGVKGRIITSTYLNFTQANALRKIKEFNNIDLNIFITDERGRGFHTKVYLFEYEEYYKIFIGSSNLTQSALKNNEEWNVKIISKKDDDFSKSILEAYDKLLDETQEVDTDFIDEYESFLKDIKVLEKNRGIRKFLTASKKIKPNSMQVKALEGLERLRNHNGKRSLVIAATGTGKTYMSAFDVRAFKAKRMLFIVHREDILRKAMSDYEKIIQDRTFGLFTGNKKDINADYIFATIQSLSRYYDEFSTDEFDYIVIDEAHHSASDTYKRVLNHFKPKFLLGMTATPERTEGTDIFSIFDNNIALEVRLNEALEQDLVVPFHYFGITDIDLIDYTGVDMNDIGEISRLLQINERVDFIIEKMNFYGFDGDKRKCIGFCANIDHANYMAQQFNLKGIKSIALTGADSVDRRREVISMLENDENELEVIFTVDLFNEGVDIPSINTVLMLRPTQSSIIFIQQLGRGLRKYEDKEFLTVLDFIGNYNKAFLIAIALNGADYYDKESLKVSLKTDFANISGCTNIQMDEIAKERILEQIDRENFNALKYLKEEYNEFKKIRGGKPITLLTDFLVYEASPNPIKFIKSTPSRSYLAFLEKVDRTFSDTKLLADKLFKDVLKDVSSKLPIKRPYEFVILKYLIENKEATREKLKYEIGKYIEFVDDATLEYTIECLRGDYYSKKESNYNFIKDLGSSIILADEIAKVTENKSYRVYIEDALNYGLLRYEKEFGGTDYGVPFFKLYGQYSRDDVVRLTNSEKKFSGYGMGGLKTNGNEWYLFVNLEKELGIKDSINHENEFIGNDIFVWQSRNTTTQDSQAGQLLINNVRENIRMHLFIRKYKEIDGATEPYIYVGLADTDSYYGEMPITTHLKLRNKVPMKILNEFNK